MEDRGERGSGELWKERVDVESRFGGTEGKAPFDSCRKGNGRRHTITVGQKVTTTPLRLERDHLQRPSAGNGSGLPSGDGKGWTGILCVLSVYRVRRLRWQEILTDSRTILTIFSVYCWMMVGLCHPWLMFPCHSNDFGLILKTSEPQSSKRYPTRHCSLADGPPLIVPVESTATETSIVRPPNQSRTVKFFCVIS